MSFHDSRYPHRSEKPVKEKKMGPKSTSDTKKESVSRRKFLKSTGAAATVSALSQQVVLGAESSRRRVRVGVVGGGFGRSFYWHKHPDSEVTAICDIRPDRLEILRETFGPATEYDDFHKMIADPNIDAVAVFTPATLHVYHACKAMEAGKHVISAVPAGCSLDECEELIETVKRTGMLYMMAETSYYRREIISARKMAAEKKFGTVFYAESEYHHEGLLSIMYDDRRLPTWRHGLPPMWYPTHNTGMIIPIMGERLVEVTCTGWGDEHEVLRTNAYSNPFWNETAFFKTSGGHSARVSVCWHVADGTYERGEFWGDKQSFFMPEPQAPARIAYANPNHRVETFEIPNHFELLPEELHVDTGHGGSHTFITHEFVSACRDGRTPEIDVYESVAYTAPGFYAHQSASRGGETLKIKDFG